MSDYDDLAEDPCRAKVTTSSERALAFVLLFVVMFGGGALALLNDSYYVAVPGVVLAYTACVMIYSFARNRGNNPTYLFTCPLVMSQYPRLLKRHAVFLAVLFTLLAIAARVIPHPDGWIGPSRSSGTPYFLVLIPIAVVALTEIMTNRGVLERAHNDRFGEPPTAETIDGTLSLFGRDQ